MAETKVGVVENFFAQIQVAAIRITDGELKVGDAIRIRGTTTDFEQKVESMQIEHEKVETAKPGDSIGMRVADRVRSHDEVLIITPD